MTGPDSAIILALALSGAGAGYLLWALWLALVPTRRGSRAAPGEGPHGAAIKPEGASAPPAPEPPPALPLFPDPTLTAQVAALRSDLAVIARAQATLLQSQSEREGRFLAEMRAVASVGDPAVTAALRRIEERLAASPEAGAGSPARAEPDPRDAQNEARLVQMPDRARPG